MMDAKEKARELIKKFRGTMTGPGIEANDRNAPVAASLCVDQILLFMENDDYKTETVGWLNSPEYQYWERVKEEIKLL